MLFTTPTQWIAVAVALVAGWLLGLASHPGGKKWKTRYVVERDTHATTRRDLEARLAAADKENARLARAAPVTAATVSPTAQAAANPAHPDDRQI